MIFWSTLWLAACIPPPMPAPAAQAEPTALERVSLPGGEVWRGEVGITFARDLLGDEVVNACLAELGQVYDSCAMRLHDCLTVVVTGPQDATVVLDAAGCGEGSPQGAWVVVDKQGGAKAKVIKP